MSGWRENISVRLLDAALDPERGRYRRDNQWDRETELDFQNRQIRERAALTALTAQMEELETMFPIVLREVERLIEAGHTETALETLREFARAALAQSDPPEDSE